MLQKFKFLDKLKAGFFYLSDCMLISLNIKPRTLDKTSNVCPNAKLRAFM